MVVEPWEDPIDGIIIHERIRTILFLFPFRLNDVIVWIKWDVMKLIQENRFELMV